MNHTAYETLAYGKVCEFLLSDWEFRAPLGGHPAGNAAALDSQSLSLSSVLTSPLPRGLAVSICPCDAVINLSL